MNALFVTVRAVHFASAIVVFGELVFVLCVAKPMWRVADNASLDGNDVSRWSVRIAVWGLVASIASGVAWLAIQAAVMSGMPLAQAVNRTTVGLVLGQTLFGRVWLLRAVIGIGVGALFLSGLVSTWYLVGDVPALIGTDYGRILLAKLALFAAMITLALVNRLRLTPRLRAHDREALHRLRRNALLEAAAGLLVVTLVSVLGITVPAAHQAPVWPFAYTLSLKPVYASVGISTALVFAASLALVAAAMALRGFRTRRSALWISGLAAICVALSISAWLLAVPAHPTSYLASPVRFTTTSIVNGFARYARDCSGCHGSQGRGDGPAAASLARKPANLVEHASQHRAGDLFWVIAHGVPGTSMPAFAPQLSASDIWDVIQFLFAQAEAADARALTSRVQPWRPVVAPDFTFEIDAQPQESLRGQRGRFVTLLVFYTLPDSLPRLRALAPEERNFAEDNVRVIAVPTVRSSRSAAAESVNDRKSIFAITRPDVAVAYAMFARRSIESGDDAPAHVEFLIDRQG